MDNLKFVVVPVLIAVTITAASFWATNAAFKNARPMLSAVLAACSVPTLLLAVAFLFLLSPNPHHYDGPGMGFAGCVMTEMFAVPLGVVTSFVALLVLKSVRKRYR